MAPRESDSRIRLPAGKYTLPKVSIIQGSGSGHEPAHVKIADLAARTPQVSECHRISGEDCFLLKLHVPAIADLEAVLDQFLRYGQTHSSFVVATPVPPRVPTAGP
ncbi:hypothetical protein Asi02nite_54110 [Asanoa siamensis]|uniref:Transcription regulator AsnC/Lrp ligand binding domain-containing protein n=1 Tax=Asanoa siamensis TaxID=926357 RepID=A0ABQ4CY21_9ACTN|nr:hypothetical protein Asi02nite_54110 [Asanoa siamensis]